MKRITAVILCVIMLFSFSVTSFAKDSAMDEKITNILMQIKPRIPDTESYEEFRSNIRTYAENTSYEFEWQNTDGNRHMAVSVCDDGVITGLTVYDNKDPYDNSPTIRKKSLKEAGEKALELLTSLNPMLENKLEIILPEYNNLYGNEYSFRIRRVENGIEVRENTGSVSIDKNAEKIKSFYMNYSPELSFEDKSKFINTEDAQKAYNEKFGMKAVYNVVYSKDDFPKTQLVYELSSDYDEYIDALSGKVYTFAPDYRTYNSAGGSSAMKENAMMDSSVEEFRLSEAELKEIDKISVLKTEEEVISSVLSNSLLDIDKNAEVTRISLIRNYNNKNKYYYSISINCPEREKEYNLTVDADDASVISYNRYDYKIDRSKELTEFPVSPREYAQKLGEKYFSADAENTYVEEEYDNNTVSYRRFVNGIECSFDKISVRLNPYDGKLDYYYVSCTDAEFQKPDNIISKSDAEKILFDNFSYMPVYLQENTKSTVPVYDFEHRGITIDAFSGELLNYSESEKITPYIDIDNHYAKEYIASLAEFGIGFSGGEFKPDNLISQGEYLTLLSAIFGSYHTPIIFKENYDFSSIYRYAERFGISDVQEDKNLTRENACVMLVKAMGYDKIASMNDLFVNKFDDVTQNVGYISILNAMEVVNGDGNGNFCPQEELTRAETAIIIFNYLNN